MTREPHSQGRAAAWRMEVDGSPHTIELEIRYSADSWLIWLDGRLISSLNVKVQNRYEFRIGSHDCVIEELDGRYSLDVDGGRIPRMDQSAELLRPAANPRDSEELLRPAGLGTAQVDKLLRPGKPLEER